MLSAIKVQNNNTQDSDCELDKITLDSLNEVIQSEDFDADDHDHDPQTKVNTEQAPLQQDLNSPE